MAAHGGHTHTSLGLDMRKLGMWTFIGSESVFFGTLIANFFRWRSSSEGGLGPEHLDINLTGAGAFVLLMSSLTMVLALAGIKSGRLDRYRLWIAATAPCRGAIPYWSRTRPNDGCRQPEFLTGRRCEPLHRDVVANTN